MERASEGCTLGKLDHSILRSFDPRHVADAVPSEEGQAVGLVKDGYLWARRATVHDVRPFPWLEES
jgi:hypothetical protein